MKATPKCQSCGYMALNGRANSNGNNSHLKGPRSGCRCIHPKAIETFKRVCPQSPKMPGFIAFTAPGGNTPKIKTAPRWCPEKQEGK